jgi:isopentenyl-diphosphate Delta-isomerase
MKENVVLVDSQDRPLGTMDKMEAHEKGLLHRAFSIFIFNTSGELLLQRRAFEKYHSGGLWSNTCCSHPRPDEDLMSAAKRRIWEEMGMNCEVEHLYSFIYKISFSNGLTEHEFDHVFIGYTNELPEINKEEVADYKYMSLEKISMDVELNPAFYTEWFKISYEKIFQYVNKKKGEL